MISESLQHRLERLDLGMVWIDTENRVTGFNEVAWQLLAPAGEQDAGCAARAAHWHRPARFTSTQETGKLALLLGGEEAAGVDQCPRALASRDHDDDQHPGSGSVTQSFQDVWHERIVGACMVYYDLTDVTTSPRVDDGSGTAGVPGAPPQPRQLSKIPVYRANRLVLIEVQDTLRWKSNDHYTWIVTASGRYLSNLSLSDLAERLDRRCFSAAIAVTS